MVITIEPHVQVYCIIQPLPRLGFLRQHICVFNRRAGSEFCPHPQCVALCISCYNPLHQLGSTASPRQWKSPRGVPSLSWLLASLLGCHCPGLLPSHFSFDFTSSAHLFEELSAASSHGFNSAVHPGGVALSVLEDRNGLYK